MLAGSVRCLIVDDSEEFLASASLLLESQGVEVVACASSGADALELAWDLALNVALVDVELGDEDGIALAQELGEHTQVVLISAYERAELGDLLSGVPFLPKKALGAPAIERLLR
jgi:CheY-like chemotaxis protein